MGRFPDGMSRAEEILLVVTPALTGIVSFVGSAIILYTFVPDWSKRMSNIKYRLLAAICFSDLVNSAVYAVWTLPSPKEVGGWGSIGNQATCAFAGFLMHLGNVGGAYNGALAVYFLLSIRYKMSDEAIARSTEVYMHVWGLAWPLITGIIAYALDVYGFGGVGCWIAPRPYLCFWDDDVPCTGGDRAYLYAWVFTGIPLFLTSQVIILAMFLIYKSVKNTYREAQQQAAERARRASILFEDLGYSTVNGDRYAERIKQAGIQAVLYSAAYLLTHGFAYVIVIYEMFAGHPPFLFVFLHVLCWPLQGFFNVFIFLRPTIGMIQRRNPSMSYLQASYYAAFKTEEPGRFSWTAEPSTRFSLSPLRLTSFLRSEKESVDNNPADTNEPQTSSITPKECDENPLGESNEREGHRSPQFEENRAVIGNDGEAGKVASSGAKQMMETEPDKSVSGRRSVTFSE